MVDLDGRVAVVTGAARGLGREHALLLARLGARVVVNDVDDTSAVVAEIEAAGGTAGADAEDVSTWDGGRRLVAKTVERFGGLDILVNNAGILRDRLIVNMTEEEWDEVLRIDLKGHFAPLRHAAEYWKDRHQSRQPVNASVVNTSSTSGLTGNFGQANYGAAKAAIATVTVIAAQELARYGVRVNAIAPAARTRLTQGAPGLGEMVAPPEDPERFDEWDPANVSPLVAWLASDSCRVTGEVFYTFGGEVAPMTGWRRRPGVERRERWTVEELAEALPPLL